MNFYDTFDNIYVINLEQCADRKENMINEFKNIGINNYQFFPGIDKSSADVSRVYNSYKVKKFPQCFRCNKNVCACKNNVITRPQVGNWLSFINIWRDIVSNRYNKVLICEDDIKFTDYAGRVLNKDIVNKIKDILNSNCPALIRLGWAKCGDHKYVKPILKENIVRMANSFHCINNKMAKLLLNKFSTIYHTSDVYIHRDIQKDCQIKNFTLFPPLTFGLSSSGDINSTIHTKNDPLYIKKLHYRRFLFTAPPQSGLPDVAQFLKNNGIITPNESMGKDGVVSWMLAVDDIEYPFGSIGIDKKDGLIMNYYFKNIVHVITNPLYTIPYILLEITKSNKAFNFIKKHTNIHGKADLETASKIFLTWHNLIKKKIPSYTIRLDAVSDVKKFSKKFKLSDDAINITRKTKYKNMEYSPPNLTTKDFNALSPDTKSKLDKFCVEFNYPRFVDRKMGYRVIDLLIVGPGGVGCSYVLSKVNDELSIKANKKGDVDGLKHLSSPNKLKRQFIVKKALFIFNDPLLAVKSHFRRKWQAYQINKLGNPNKFNTKKKLSYPAFCKEVENKCTDVFGIEYQYDNWINEYKDFPVMFAHFPDIKNNSNIISKFTGIKKSFFDNFQIKKRKSKEGDESELVKKVYEDLYNKMLSRGEYYIV